MAALRWACSTFVGRPSFLGITRAGGGSWIMGDFRASHPSMLHTRNRRSRTPNLMEGGAVWR